MRWTMARARSGSRSPGGLGSREEAFRTLEQVAQFFRRTEPHSPISYQLEQAVRWGRLPLPDLIHELIADPARLDELARGGLRVVDRVPGRPFSEIQRERAASAPDGVPSGYLPLALVESQMSAAAASFPAICQLVDVTATYGVPATEEGRHVLAVKISDNVALDEDELA